MMIAITPFRTIRLSIGDAKFTIDPFIATGIGLCHPTALVWSAAFYGALIIHRSRFQRKNETKQGQDEKPCEPAFLIFIHEAPPSIEFPDSFPL
jgi:hypothetical protein